MVEEELCAEVVKGAPSVGGNVKVVRVIFRASNGSARVGPHRASKMSAAAHSWSEPHLLNLWFCPQVLPELCQ
jgi:hypothetical protein